MSTERRALFPAPAEPFAWETKRDTAIVESTIELARAKEIVAKEIHEGVLRPFDIDSAEIEEPRALWVPFWRVAVTIDALQLNGERFRDALVMICARSSFPYKTKIASPLQLADSELTDVDVDEAMSGENAEIVQPDISREKAESIVQGELFRSASPTHALYSHFEPKIRSARFCFYPVYYTRYHYRGEARRHVGEEFFVAISARSGQILSGAHPSAVRGAAAKLRRFLSMDHRR